MEEENVYSTRDLYLASTLITLKHNMSSVDFQIEGEKRQPVGYFNFEDSEELQDNIQKYWHGDLLVEPKTFVTNLRSLKAQISNVYNSPRTDFSKMKKSE